MSKPCGKKARGEARKQGQADKVFPERNTRFKYMDGIVPKNTIAMDL